MSEVARPSAAALVARIHRDVRARADAVLLIGGGSGAGKSTFAAVARAALGGVLVSMEDLYRGWDGLDAGSDLLARLLADRAAGRPAVFAPWDWAAERPASTRRLPATGLLIVEGGGAVTPATARFADCTVVLDVPAAVRIRRALARDPVETHALLTAWAGRERRAAAMHGRPAGLIARGGVAPSADLREGSALGNTLGA